MLGPHSPCAMYSYAAILWILHAPCIRALLYGQAHTRRLVVGAVGAHGANDSAGPVIQNTITDISRNSRRYVYQLVEKLGWVWIPPSLVVLLPFRLYLSQVSQSYRWPLRHQIPCFISDVMAGGHILQLGRSTSLQHVNALDICRAPVLRCLIRGPRH
jgi:hypothetical protein